MTVSLAAVFLPLLSSYLAALMGAVPIAFGFGGDGSSR